MPEKVFDLLDQMTFKHDNYTLPVLFNLCAQVANDQAMNTGRKLFHEIPVSYRNDNETKQQGAVLNEDAWNILIGTCSKVGMIRQSQYIIDQIPLHILNLKQIQISLVHMWSKCGSIKMAQSIFKSVHDHDVVTYNAMINEFGLNEMGFEAIELYRQIPNELRDEVTHICVLNACSHAGLLDQARNIFNEISFKTTKILTVMVCFSI
ncbi:unnamed protein product [Rotaria sordida]|uniref:Pentatricopeptide repeat-containing protein n=1 Tax=Rotaria sordida TaxID=392033 RepID=A0A815RPE3_9BILA|nr:unnamed protein product [Rotaria sordida]CAF1480561.1 unnamed protein product [Rotaria sordida]